MSTTRNSVREKKNFILLGGEERELHFGYLAFDEIEDHYDGVSNMQEAVRYKPFRNLPFLIYCGLKNKTPDITPDVIAVWLDDLGGIDEITETLTTVTAILYDSIPEAKGKGKKANPPKSEPTA